MDREQDQGDGLSDSGLAQKKHAEQGLSTRHTGVAYIGTTEALPSGLLALILSRIKSAKVRCCPNCPSGACNQHAVFPFL